MSPSLAWLNHEHRVPISASPSGLQNSQSVVFLIVCSIHRAVSAYCATCLFSPRPSFFPRTSAIAHCHFLIEHGLHMASCSCISFEAML